jgi:hypothetical protein
VLLLPAAIPHVLCDTRIIGENALLTTADEGFKHSIGTLLTIAACVLL